MGVFTVYCILCGGPPMDISNWVANREIEEEGFEFGGLDFAWLQEAVAITSKSIVYGYCDDYGQLEGNDCEGNRCNVCVLKGNWEHPKPKVNVKLRSARGKKCDADEEVDFINGILAHRLCWDMLLQRVDTTMGFATLFRRLSTILMDYSQCLLGISYHGIEKNQEQDYELCANEGHFVSDPRPLCGVRTHTNPLQRMNGDFATVPLDCLPSLLSYCDIDMLLALGCASKSTCAATRHEAVYNSYVSADLTYEDKDGELLVFEHPTQKANHIRISNIIEQVAAKVNPVKAPPKKKKRV